MKLLTVSANPHVRDNSSTTSIMLDVVIALFPTVLAAVILFGVQALMVVAVCVASCVLSEYFWELALKKPVTVGDLSAVVTGVLLACCLPPSIPLWQAALGGVAAILVVKQLFGGIGCNFANPAATARIILFLCFSKEMATFTYDGATAATPLAGAKVGLADLFLGRHGGSLGEVCALALLLGGAYLLVRGVISWHIPAAFLGTVFLCGLLAGQDPIAQVLSGGALLGAIFMATDYATSPMTEAGKLIYGVIIGLITMAIRLWGNYPEGVSFAILLGNILTPHIDKLTRHRPLGVEKKGGAKA